MYPARFVSLFKVQLSVALPVPIEVAGGAEEGWVDVVVEDDGDVVEDGDWVVPGGGVGEVDVEETETVGATSRVRLGISVVRR